MWASDLQRCQAIRKLLSLVQLEHLWTESGPTPLATKYRKSSPLSTGERILLLAAFDLWNGTGRLTFYSTLLTSLDHEKTEQLCSLVIALSKSSAAVDEWLARPVPQETPIDEMPDGEIIAKLGLDPTKWKVTRPESVLPKVQP